MCQIIKGENEKANYRSGCRMSAWLTNNYLPASLACVCTLISLGLYLINKSTRAQLRAMTDDELRDEINECMEFYEDPSWYVMEMKRRGLEARE